MIKSKYILAITGLATALIIFGCSSTQVVPPKTQLQIREFQTRIFDTKDVSLILKAMINVLQDEGFIIKSASVDLGLISATKEVDKPRDVRLMGSLVIRDTAARIHVLTECSANISEFGNKVRVRINFQEKTSDENRVLEVRSIDDEIYYQSFFAKVDKSIFIQKEKL